MKNKNFISGKYVINTLKKHIDNGKRAIFVQINCPNGKTKRFGAHQSIEIWNGVQAYTFLSGRETFFDDLIKTVQYVFTNFKTYSALKQNLKIV